MEMKQISQETFSTKMCVLKEISAADYLDDRCVISKWIWVDSVSCMMLISKIWQRNDYHWHNHLSFE